MKTIDCGKKNWKKIWRYREKIAKEKRKKKQSSKVERKKYIDSEK